MKFENKKDAKPEREEKWREQRLRNEKELQRINAELKQKKIENEAGNSKASKPSS